MKNKKLGLKLYLIKFEVICKFECFYPDPYVQNSFIIIRLGT